MRLHDVTVSPRSVRIDGVSIIVEQAGPQVETVGPGVHIVHIPLIAQTVTLTGDTHAPDTRTPVYDQLLQERKEREGQA